MDGDQLVDFAESLTDREGFLQFLEELVRNRRQFPEEWENNTLDNFLNAFMQFSKDAGGYYRNFGREDVDIQTPSWRMIADALLASKVYE